MPQFARALTLRDPGGGASMGQCRAIRGHWRRMLHMAGAEGPRRFVRRVLEGAENPLVREPRFDWRPCLGWHQRPNWFRMAMASRPATNGGVRSPLGPSWEAVSGTLDSNLAKREDFLQRLRLGHSNCKQLQAVCVFATFTSSALRRCPAGLSAAEPHQR